VLQDRDEELFYRFVMDNVTEIMPFICERASVDAACILSMMTMNTPDFCS
jgi:hypothetical protein